MICILQFTRLMLHNQAEEDKDSEQETERLAGERVHSHGLPSEKNLSGCPNVSREELHRPAAEWPSFHPANPAQADG